MKLICAAAFLIVETLCYPSKETEVRWNIFKAMHKRSYDSVEEKERFAIFTDNLGKIEDHNKLYEQNKISYKMSLNQFADMTHEEYLQYSSGYKYNATYDKIVVRHHVVSTSEIPDEIDWRKKGAVTEVKNQGTCGSCWAFSTTGSLEGQNFLKTGRLISLSEQELIDCIVMRAVRGCNGGLTDRGFEYVIRQGLASEADYPYKADDDLCHRGSIKSSVTEIGYVRIFGNEDALKEAVATVGPIAVNVDASQWQFYSGGIFYIGDCQTDPNFLNHAVLAVGYGVENGTEYWLVKNSYGPEWGEEGYIRLARNANNLCGIATSPSYPIL